MKSLDKDKEMDFLRKLDEKLHHVSQHIFNPNMSGGSLPAYADNYTKTQITDKELGRMVSIVEKRNDLAIYPINTSMGFSVGFEISQLIATFPGVEEKESIVRFREDQLPKGHDFYTMSMFFLDSKNMELTKKITGQEIQENRDYYDY